MHLESTFLSMGGLDIVLTPLKQKRLKKNHIQRAFSLAVTFSHQPTTPSESHQMSAPPGILHVWELQCLHLGGVHQLILLGDQDLQTIRKELFAQDTVGNWPKGRKAAGKKKKKISIFSTVFCFKSQRVVLRCGLLLPDEWLLSSSPSEKLLPSIWKPSSAAKLSSRRLTARPFGCRL